MQVVDDDEQRAARRRLTEQRQRCAQHREAVRCRAGTDAERNLERHATGPWDAPQIVGQRINELVEAGEADVRLVLHAAAMDHADTVGRGHLRRREQQCRLAHSGLARQQERRTTDSGLAEERIEGCQFAVATDQAVGPGTEINHRSRPPAVPMRGRAASVPEKLTTGRVASAAVI